MDIFRFINSKDIRAYLKEIDYKFNSLEAAWLVYQCYDATIEEKHQAWNEIIETMPDCRIEGRRFVRSQESLNDFLKKYMEIEDGLISGFYDEKHDDTFSDEKPYVYRFEYVCKDGTKYDWGTVFSCYDALLETIMEPDEDVAFISCFKMRIDRLSRWSENVIISPKFEILSIDPGLISDDEANNIFFDVFSDMWFDFPTPFKKGDILWKPGRFHVYNEGPFALETICLNGIEDERVIESIVKYGDNTDMFTSGYFVNEDGTIYRECMDNYMDLEYYDKELSGSAVLLNMISNLIKGETKRDLLEWSCQTIAFSRIKESLCSARLSPEHIKIWMDDTREAPEGYIHCKSVNETIRKITECEKRESVIDVIDCDHDLGDYNSDGGDGIKLIDWLVERKSFYPIKLHTMNPVGRDNMQREIDRYWKGRYGKININELLELNSWDDSFARVILDDYDWMHYTIEFTFRTEKYGKMNLKFEFTGIQESTMTITNGEMVTVYKYDSKLFEKWIIPYLSRHNEQWEPPKAFRGEDIILDFYNDVIENGTIVNGG